MSSGGWSQSYTVGSDELDRDHRILVALLAQLAETTETGQSRDVIGSVVSALAEYVEDHFLREEAIMAASGFPALEAHKLEHRALEQRVATLRDRYFAGEKGVLGEEVIELLKKWLTEHILVTDNSYRPWVERMTGAGQKPEPMVERGGVTS